MEKLIIEGNQNLTGEIRISGAKNSAVALIPAAILSDDKSKITNVPLISDIDALNDILIYLGAKVERDNNTIIIDSKEIVNKEIPENISKKLRASYYFMSALLGKYKKVTMYFPGGCSIGKRPIDQTLKAYKKLGATVIEENNKLTITATELVGNEVVLDMPSVGATINTMLVAVKAIGTTKIVNAAREPEITNIALFLNSMGAKIKGAGTNTIIIEGVKNLHSGFAEVIPDRIETGTYIILGALVGNNLKISNIIKEHVDSLLDILNKMGVDYKINDNSIEISKAYNLKPVNISTGGYPCFATDLQQPLTSLLIKCNGTSTLYETIYEDRFKNVEYLNKMGANIEFTSNRIIKITGPSKLIGTEVEATDLRAGACLVLAALQAEGTTTITNISYVLRGYEKIVEKLTSVGAKIKYISE